MCPDIPQVQIRRDQRPFLRQPKHVPRIEVQPWSEAMDMGRLHGGIDREIVREKNSNFQLTPS